ncbi:hypothetical protein HLB23_30575 [Nocardia uniformis]|uniref:Uncharacterized protein n=1 Tax=Nocardia uniformis TaxID=53432 RepID=A0A849C8K2_9NOCA|nr:hypothetical protein [Nocardia uniformis]NNH74146.1 hypothetical protein [Nocardia uniformis]
MEFLVIMLIAAVMLAAIAATSTTPRHHSGPTVAEIQARLAAEQRTYLPLRGW